MAKAQTPLSCRLDEAADRHIRQTAQERGVSPSQIIQEMYDAWVNQNSQPEPEPEPTSQQNAAESFDQIDLPDNLEADFQRKHFSRKAKNRHTYLLKLFAHARKWFW